MRAVKTTFINHPNVGGYVNISKERRVHYVRAGKGRSLLLVHTYGQSLYTWRYLFQDMSRYYDVIAVDLPGHGYSSCPRKGYTVQDHAQALGALAQALELENPQVLAFSLGCAVALEWMANAPVAQAMLLSPGGITRAMPKLVRQMAHSPFRHTYAKMLNKAALSEIIRMASFDKTFMDEEQLEYYYAPFRVEGVRRGMAQSLRRFDDGATLSKLSRVRSEVLLVRGMEDTWHGRGELDLYMRALPRAAAVPVRNAGHLIQEEKPTKILQLVLEFFDQA